MIFNFFNNNKKLKTTLYGFLKGFVKSSYLERKLFYQIDRFDEREKNSYGGRLFDSINFRKNKFKFEKTKTIWKS